MREVCKQKGLDETLTRFALGCAVCNADKGETVEVMIGEVMRIVEKFRQMLKGLVMYVKIANPKYT